jgi:hypothetical protein
MSQGKALLHNLPHIQFPEWYWPIWVCIFTQISSIKVTMLPKSTHNSVSQLCFSLSPLIGSWKLLSSVMNESQIVSISKCGKWYLLEYRSVCNMVPSGLYYLLMCEWMERHISLHWILLLHYPWDAEQKTLLHAPWAFWEAQQTVTDRRQRTLSYLRIYSQWAFHNNQQSRTVGPKKLGSVLTFSLSEVKTKIVKVILSWNPWSFHFGI